MLQFAQLCCAASLVTNTPQAMRTEAADAGNTDAVLAGDGTTSAMRSDLAVTTSATATGDSAQAKPASPIHTTTDEQLDRPHPQHVAAVAAVPGVGINPVASIVDQVGTDVTLYACWSATSR